MASSAETTGAGDQGQGAGQGDGETRRDFLLLATCAVGAAGASAAVWPFIDQMNPAADTLAVSTTEVNLEPIKPGQRILVKWQGKPVFIMHRTKEQIEKMRGEDDAKLPDPQKDADRTQKPEWLVVVGVCTHLGCIPTGTKQGEVRGEYDGWFCPCHGSHYDLSGRIRKGPAPKNLPVPGYAFLPDGKVLIGKTQEKFDKEQEELKKAKAGAAG